jgi:hypothetical protein
MNQRLYFLLPDREHTLGVINELVERGFDTRQMHTLAGKGLSSEGLPGSNSVLSGDFAGRLFLLGASFTHLPNTHLSEFADALKHGEILLMVDASSEQANEVEHCVQDHHPEAVAGGSSWNTPMLGT